MLVHLNILLTRAYRSERFGDVGVAALGLVMFALVLLRVGLS